MKTIRKKLNKSCRDCKHFRSAIPYEDVDRCVARDENEKVLSNFGLLFLDLGNECKDWEENNGKDN